MSLGFIEKMGLQKQARALQLEVISGNLGVMAKLAKQKEWREIMLQLQADAQPAQDLSNFVNQNVVENQELKAINDQLIDFYNIFIDVLSKLAIEPITVDALIDKTCLHKTQINEWLHRASDDGIVKKLNRPIRYQFIGRK